MSALQSVSHLLSPSRQLSCMVSATVLCAEYDLEEEEEEFYKLLPANKADHLCHTMAGTTDVYLPMKSRQPIMK